MLAAGSVAPGGTAVATGAGRATGTGGGTSRPPVSTRTVGSEPSAPPVVAPTSSLAPQVVSLGGSAHCATGAATGQATLTWTSQHATSAWVVPLTSATVPAALDPAKVRGAEGPLAPAGAVTVTFDCTRSTGYFVVRVTAGTRHGDRVLAVTASR